MVGANSGALQAVNKTTLPQKSSFIVPRKGLHLPGQLSFEKWFEIGHHLSSLNSSSAWCLGDWLIYGEAAYSGRYRTAIEQTSLDYQTLRNYAWVAKRFTLSRRRETLSFGHHAEVAALPTPEQDYWLKKAEELSWSRNKLRREVRGSIRERRQQGIEPTQDRPAIDGGTEPHTEPRERMQLTLEFTLTSQQMELCEAAAGIYGLNTRDWMLRTLEEAARNALRPA